MVPKLLKVNEAAKATGLARWRLYDLMARGEGPPHMRVGRSIRISETALAEWIEQQHQEHSGGPRSAVDGLETERRSSP